MLYTEKLYLNSLIKLKESSTEEEEEIEIIKP